MLPVKIPKMSKVPVEYHHLMSTLEASSLITRILEAIRTTRREDRLTIQQISEQYCSDLRARLCYGNYKLLKQKRTTTLHTGCVQPYIY